MSHISKPITPIFVAITVKTEEEEGEKFSVRLLPLCSSRNAARARKDQDDAAAVAVGPVRDARQEFPLRFYRRFSTPLPLENAQKKVSFLSIS